MGGIIPAQSMGNNGPPPDNGRRFLYTRRVMTSEHLLPLVQPLCSGVDEDIIRDFLSRMDEDYLNEFTPGQIADHVSLAARLDPEHPSHTTFIHRPDGSVDLVIVAYDYFSEFAVICGLLASFGLDIREGRIFTSGEPVTTPPARR